MDQVSKLGEILRAAVPDSRDSFTGFGVILYREKDRLPVFPLRLSHPTYLPSESISSILRQISVPESVYHDGFHLISGSWMLTHVAQYFSPPIVDSVSLPDMFLPGGRYMAALFGSAIDGVDLTAIVGADFRLAIFRSGNEVYGEQLR